MSAPTTFRAPSPTGARPLGHAPETKPAPKLTPAQTAVEAANKRAKEWADKQPKAPEPVKAKPAPHKQDAPPPPSTQITAKDIMAGHKASMANLRETRLRALARRNADVAWLLNQKSHETKAFKSVA